MSCSAAQLAYTGVIDPESEIFQRFVSFFEQNRAVDYFMGNIDQNVTYMGIAERDLAIHLFDDWPMEKGLCSKPCKSSIWDDT